MNRFPLRLVRLVLAACIGAFAILAAGHAQARTCEPLKTSDIQNVLDAAAQELAPDHDPAAHGRDSVLSEKMELIVDVYQANFDQFVPDVYVGSDGWDRFRRTIGADKLKDFRFESVLVRTGCTAAYVTGRYWTSGSDEFVPWIYNAIVSMEDGKLKLRSLKLPTAIPRKFYGDDDKPCGATTDRHGDVDTLRAAFVAALQSGSDDRLAALFDPHYMLSYFEPTYFDRVRGSMQSAVARAATARFFKGMKQVEDLPEEHRVQVFCSNLQFGGALKLTATDGFVVFIGYRVYSGAAGEKKSISSVHLNLADIDIINNLPPDLPDFTEKAVEGIKRWGKP